MKEKPDYAQDITEIRSMMERSSKFLSLSGLAGILAGIYALAGVYIAYKVLDFHPGESFYNDSGTDGLSSNLVKVIIVALIVLILALGTAVFLSSKKAHKSGERLWNATTRRILYSMAIPLVTGGLLILVLIAKGLIGLMAPITLLFYGLALFNAGKFTYDEVKTMGLIEIVLGLISAYYTGYGILCWALGFGAVHIIYGIYLHYKYER